MEGCLKLITDLFFKPMMLKKMGEDAFVEALSERTYIDF